MFNPALFVVLATLLIVPLSNGLYFHIGETERKCFIEEIPDETTVVGKANKSGRANLHKRSNMSMGR